MLWGDLLLTVMGGSAADTVMGDLLLTLLWGDLLLTLLWGDLLLEGHRLCHSCMGTAVLHNLCGSAAVAKLQLPSSQPVQA